MQDLVNAIHDLAVRDWVDYLAILAPLILSTVAVVISICTATKQNKIAIFEKRYECYSSIKKFTSFADGIKDAENARIVCALFNTFFLTHIQKGNSETFIPALAVLKELESKITQGIFLFDVFSNNIDLLEIAKYTISLLEGLTDEESIHSSFTDNVRENRDKLCDSCELFSQTKLKAMEKQLKL